MSKLLKSKFLLGVVAVAVMFVGVVAVSNTASAATCTITTTLRVGSKGDEVKCLQAAVGVSQDGSFGPKTKVAVVAWQKTVSGLVADGIFGAKSRVAWMGSPVTPPVTPPVATGPVTVALATDNPASGSFIAPASGVQFAKFTFSGAGTVTSVKLMRKGVSSSSTVNNVYLYDGATRLTDGASIGSDNTVTFNSVGGIFTVAGSKTITVVADTLVADYSLALALTSYTAGGVATTVNVSGNEMYGASATLATVALAASTGSGATDAGLDISVWQSTATVATRDVILKSLALRQIGSIVSADINNFKLYVDGVWAATVANSDANGYVTFAPSVVLKTGARVLKVTADVLGGSGRTVSMSLRGTYDFIATDTQYNANGTATGTFPNTATAFTVNSGTLTVVKKNDSQSSNVTIGASDQSLATYTFTAYGEAVKVETLRVGMITTGGTVTDNTLRNVRILVNGAQVGSNTSVPAAASFAAASGTSFTTNFVVYPGTPATVEIRSDIFDNESTDDITAGTTTAVQAVLVGGAATSNGVPQVSLGTINVPTSANVLGNNLTIASGSMSIATTTSYVSRSVAVPATAYKIGSFQLTGNSTEAVNLNTVYVGFTAGSTVTEETDLSDLYYVMGGVQSTVKGTVSSTILNGNSWSINKTLAKNETIQVDVYATLASTVSTNAVIATLAVAGTTVNSGITTYADASGITTLTAGVTGQTITGATGSVTISKDTSNTLKASIVDDSGTLKTLTAKIEALTDTYTVTDFTVTVSNVSAVSTVTLKDRTTGAVIGAAKSAATSLTWSGLNYVVSAGSIVRVDVELALAPVGVDAGTTGSALTTSITAFTARNGAGTSATGTGTAVGNAVYVYKAIPTLATANTPTGNGTLGSGTQTLSKFSVSTNGTGTIGWNRLIFTIAKTSAPTLASFTLWDVTNGTAVSVPGTATIVDSANDATCLATLLSCAVRFVPTAEQQVSSTAIYALKATVAGTLISTDSVTTTMTNPGGTLGFVASAAYATVAATGSFSATSYATYLTSPSFVWSDVSKASHDTTTTDWSNDYLVPALPLDSQALHV